jgi:Carboxypeptidase regulatory-like domain/TonB-dependent Receptor Plug Domain/TonB dependent receptor
VFASLFGSGAAWGQTNGDIRGTVNDPSGAVVPNATVTATLTGTDSVRVVTSDKDGAFVIPELAVGSYSVSAEAQGFKKLVTTDVVVTIGHVNFITITLQVGGSADTVTVEANAAQVETTSTQLGAVMTDTAIVQLPMNTRNAYSLLQLQPGVQSQLGNDLFFGSDNAGAVSVNGGRGRANNYMVNGGDGNDIFVNAPAIQPSPDAIEEFRVLTNTFDAEYGRNSGSVVNVVTKSGTNALHGDFYEFLRNDALNTKGYFDPFLLDYKQNQFGATLGAPIKKDKTFIFGSYEGNRLVQGVSSGTVFLPSTAEVGGDFSNGILPTSPNFTPFVGGTDANFASILNSRPGCTAAITAGGGTAPAAGALYSNIFPANKIPTSCFDPTAVGVFNHYVLPFQQQADPTTNQLISSGNRHLRTDQFTVRLDHSITPSQKFTAYYYFEDDDRTDPFSTFQAAGANLPGFDALFKTRTQQWNLSHTWTIGSTAVNEFRFNYFRESQESQNHPLNTFATVQDSCVVIPAANCFTDPANPQLGITTNLPGRVGLPFINVSGGFAIGNNFEGELPQTGNTFQWTDNYTKTMGKHTIKFGGDVRRQRFDQFLFFEVSGNYSFINQANGDQIASTDAYPNYFLGAADSYQQGSAQGENVRNTALYLFAQDSYKVSNSVTLNYGLRWELNTPYYDRGNRIQTFRPGQATTQYPCFISGANAATLNLQQGGNCGQDTTNGNNAVFPLGLVFPGDKGVPRGLTTTYYKAFAPRIGIAWSPGATDGLIAKITGGPGKLSVRAGFGIFYNPIEQLVLEQFSAEPPFGGSTFLSQTLFNTPFAFQSGSSPAPNPFMGVINQTPQTPCAVDGGTGSAGPAGCVDWSTFRPLLLFGEFQPHLKSQYSEQYNLTIERQLTKDMLFRISYVGTQAHHLLASHDLNAGNAQTCDEIGQIFNNDPTGVLNNAGCGPVGADAEYQIPTTYSDGSHVIVPTYVPPAQPFKVPASTCSGLPLPYNAGSSVNCIPGGTDLATSPLTPNGITFVGTRPFSSPNCQPLSAGAVGCPADGVPVFSNIFAEDTIANSNYNALQISVEKNYTHGLLFQASYTFSKAIDQGASFEQQLNPLNFNATRGLSLLSAKNRFVFSPVWELPIPKQEGVAGKFANGWQLSAIITYQSGFPIRIEDQNDGELQSSFFFEDANTPTVNGKIQFVNPKRNGGIFFNSDNFTDPTLSNPPPLGQFGNVPHSLCCGPPISNTDFVVSKKTPINERWNTEFRAEFYNLFNHTQFSNPDGNFTDGPAGSFTPGVPLPGTFGVVLTTREPPRVLQFGLKFLF